MVQGGKTRKTIFSILKIERLIVRVDEVNQARQCCFHWNTHFKFTGIQRAWHTQIKSIEICYKTWLNISSALERCLKHIKIKGKGITELKTESHTVIKETPIKNHQSNNVFATKTLSQNTPEISDRSFLFGKLQDGASVLLICCCVPSNYSWIVCSWYKEIMAIMGH